MAHEAMNDNSSPTLLTSQVSVPNGKCGLAALANLTNDLRFLNFPTRTDEAGNNVGYRTLQLNKCLQYHQYPYLFDTVEASISPNYIERDRITWLIREFGLKDYLTENNFISVWLCHVQSEQGNRHAVLVLFNPSTNKYALLDSRKKEAVCTEGLCPIQDLQVYELSLLVDSFGSPAPLTSAYFPKLDI